MAIALTAGTAACSNTPEQTPCADNGQAVIENIMTRCSVRQYTPDVVSQDTIEILLRAAMAAPTAVNKQPWKFVVLKDPDLRATLADSLPNAGEKLLQASVAIVVCGDSTKFFDHAPEFWIQDCSAATENLLLAAHAVGLGAVWCGIYPNVDRVAAVREVLDLDETLVPLCVVPVGYPAEQPQIKDKWNTDNIIYK